MNCLPTSKAAIGMRLCLQPKHSWSVKSQMFWIVNQSDCKISDIMASFKFWIRNLKLLYLLIVLNLNKESRNSSNQYQTCRFILFYADRIIKSLFCLCRLKSISESHPSNSAAPNPQAYTAHLWLETSPRQFAQLSLTYIGYSRAPFEGDITVFVCFARELLRPPPFIHLG
jgi:hypothetical protein